ncbi:MAG: glucose 1-dehydrogenase [Chitinophagales bacterium]|nr:glucose 1-dehydrogenase [Chitinophagales bacterium]MCZ2394635.1 glucose 1-dehydrogenase [Chitinophagales bacterium]
MIQDLKGKTAIVTGASKGIGEAIARYFARGGANVVVNSRKQEEIDVVVAAIKEFGGNAIAVAGNVGDIEDAKNLIETTLQAYGGIDILVNNAVANPYYGPIVGCDDLAFDKTIAINVKAPFELSKMAYPIMKSNGGGSIINISSVEGISPHEGMGIYSVSKAALNMLTKSCAIEWGADNIRVNSVCPGLIKTKFSKALWSNEQWVNHFVGQLPLKRVGTVEEIAALVYFLASDASSYVTGAVYTADGGLTL